MPQDGGKSKPRAMFGETVLPEAVLINPGENRKYGDVLKEFRFKINPVDVNV